jgi:hypothetical protein
LIILSITFDAEATTVTASPSSSITTAPAPTSFGSELLYSMEQSVVISCIYACNVLPKQNCPRPVYIAMPKGGKYPQVGSEIGMMEAILTALSTNCGTERCKTLHTHFLDGHFALR